MADIRIIILGFIAVPCWGKGVLGVCPAGQFGDLCEYFCHCGSSCDRTTGDCFTACDKGWFKGDNKCQKENIALRKEAWTTSGTWTRNSWLASGAVDGNNVDLDNPGTCFHAASAPSDWTVDLGQEYQLCDIRVYPRKQLCSHGTYGIQCSKFCYCSDCERLTGVCTGDCRPGWQGQKCDTECIDTYGINCNKTCPDRRCSAKSAPCDRFTGSCDGGCLPGWIGNDCTNKCDSLHYGENCSSVCSERHCLGTTSCDHVTGTCDYGCVAGWSGQDCQQACDSEHYGPGCTGVCATRHCITVSSCRSNTGRCDGECQKGWAGISCTECDREHYGPDCTRTCAARHCEGGSSCSPSTGDCDGGCQPGWVGADCTERHSSMDQGETTTSMNGTGNSFKNQTAVVVGTVSAVVVVILLLITLGVLIWGRKRGRPGKEANCDHVYYNSATPAVSVKEPGSELSLEGSLPVGDDEGQTYTTIDPGCCQGNPELVDKSQPLNSVRGPDDYEPVSGRTYEKLSMSRDQESEYTGLERKYENIKTKSIIK